MRPAHDPLVRAFERAAERLAAGKGQPGQTAVRLAQRVLRARAADLGAEACPAGVRARVVAAFARREGVLSTLARLLFDPRRAPAAVRRGTATGRTLRFAAGEVVLDMEVGHAVGRHVLQLAVEGAPGEVWFAVEGRPHATRRLVRADATGYAAVRLPHDLRAVVVRIMVYGLERLRTPEIDLTT